MSDLFLLSSKRRCGGSRRISCCRMGYRVSMTEG